jgi:hypothetical protein
VAGVVFDLDDFDAAFAELDARYIAGEGAAHAGRWSLIAGAFVSLNRHEFPPATTDVVSLDHRRGPAFAPGEGFEYIRAGWDLDQTLNLYIETAHRVNDRGAVFTWTGYGTSHEGFDAEWRGVEIMTVDGDLLSRAEVFDEADLDAALAKFDQLSQPARRLENAASRTVEQLLARFSISSWDAMAELLADDTFTDDRRSVVNGGIRRGRDAEMANWRATGDIWSNNVRSTVIATRGDHIALMHFGFTSQDQPMTAFHAAAYAVVEIYDDNCLAASTVFDLDDIDAAFAELDARYIAGEAAAHSHTWSAIARVCEVINRQQEYATTPDWVNVDHRRAIKIAPGELFANMHAAWELAPDLIVRTEAAHRLTNVGAVVTVTACGSSPDGFDAEWRMILLLTVEGDRISRCEVFDEADLDAAVAKFNQLSIPALRLKNAVAERLSAHIVARDWEALAQDFAEDYCLDDRRRVVNAGVMHGRDAGVDNTRVAAEVGLLTNTMSTIIASRGERLTLERFHASGPDRESIQSEALNIVEIDADERIAAVVMFDMDDMDAAFAELDARYLAGEAAPHAHTWLVISQAYAALNGRTLPATTPDWTSIDHRRFGTIEANALTPNLRAWWDLTSEVRIDIEAVHQLTNLGAVVTHLHRATWDEGAEIESSEIIILMVDGDLLSRCEIFDESDLDAALARFEEMHSQTRRHQNAASCVTERCRAALAVRDWDAMAEILAEGFSSEDRRRVVNSGIRQGRDLGVRDMQAAVDVIGITYRSSVVIATRGERLELISARVSNDKRPETVQFEVLQLSEIDTDGRVAAVVTMDIDDIDAAFEELDTRYLAGEAAAHAQTWSVIANATAAFNRHEMPSVTPHWVNIDHRRVTAFVPGDMAEYIRATWDVAPVIRNHIVTMHRLTDLGAVVTQASHGTSQEGFEAEWREVTLLTVEGNSLNRVEIFDEADLDAALARFEELQPQPPRPENAASQVYERFLAHFVGREWAAMAELLADDIVGDDRRRVVNSGVRRGRELYIADMRAAVEIGAETISPRVIATRGERLALAHVHIFSLGEASAEMLFIVEIDTDEQLARVVAFDVDDIDAAFEELDARYLAGEAAAHTQTWSVIANATAAFNRHELPAADWVIIDHRPLAPVDASDLPAAIRAIWDLTPDLSTRIEAVHRLSSFGAVVTNTASGRSPEGFAAEWRVVDLVTVEGDRISRDEFFDEADLDAALARFEELHPQAPRLENAAGRILERYQACFSARDWAAVAELLAGDIVFDDRRRVVNAGVRRGREVHVADLRAAVEVGAETVSASVVATRAERLALAHARAFNRGSPAGEVGAEWLGVAEIDTDDRMVAFVAFDLDDMDAAFEELDARYLAGEAAAHSNTWSVITHAYAAFNRHELAAADWVTIDHRPLVAIGPNDLPATIRAVWDLTPDVSIHVEAVHRLSSFGAVVTDTMYGTSPEGFDAEWRMIQLLTVEGDRIKRCEVFDEADLDAALARFDELEQRTPFENVATRTWLRVADAFNCRDAEGLLGLASTEGRYEDRRKGLRNALVGPARRKAVQAMFETMPTSWRLELEFIAVRGARLSLTRERYRDAAEIDRPITSEILRVMEVDDRGLMQDAVSFDPDDINDAFAELTTRWIASGEVAYPEVIEAVDRINATINRHDWDAVATHFVGAEYVNHRQLAHAVDGTIADWLSSLQTTGSLVPNLWVELAEVLARCAIGIVGRMALKGRSTDGAAIEIPFVVLILLHGERVTRLEAFEEDQRDSALARLQEFSLPV